MKNGATLRVDNLGPISTAEVAFGDLTVLVGPQAGGKGLFLRTLKLVLDRGHIINTFKENHFVVENDPDAFMDAYYGHGMSQILNGDPTVVWNGAKHGLAELAETRGSGRDGTEKLFFIPAQRATALQSGTPRHFGSFEFGDPFALCHFADQVHKILRTGNNQRNQVFPSPNRLNKTLSDPIDRHLFHGARVSLEPDRGKMRLTLRAEGTDRPISFLSWSAGQREFLPLLLGLYRLLPRGGDSRRENLEWVVIEEPESGLHPQAATVIPILVLELMRRGYKIAISSHSTSTLDFVWAIREIQECGGGADDVGKLLRLPATPQAKRIAEVPLTKEIFVHFLHEGGAEDISSLDPGSDNPNVSGWGGLSEFADHAGDIVSDVNAGKYFGKRK